ncbi:MAG: hypothetical protein EZS28_041632, partial [Streblomastix strix]
MNIPPQPHTKLNYVDQRCGLVIFTNDTHYQLCWRQQCQCCGLIVKEQCVLIGLIDIQYEESGVDSSESWIFKLKGYNCAFSAADAQNMIQLSNPSDCTDDEEAYPKSSLFRTQNGDTVNVVIIIVVAIIAVVVPIVCVVCCCLAGFMVCCCDQDGFMHQHCGCLFCCHTKPSPRASASSNYAREPEIDNRTEEQKREDAYRAVVIQNKSELEREEEEEKRRRREELKEVWSDFVKRQQKEQERDEQGDFDHIRDLDHRENERTI